MTMHYMKYCIDAMQEYAELKEEEAFEAGYKCHRQKVWNGSPMDSDAVATMKLGLKSYKEQKK